MKENTINQFLVSAIGHASAVAIDTRFSLRVRDVRETPAGKVRIQLESGRVVILEQSGVRLS